MEKRIADAVAEQRIREFCGELAHLCNTFNVNLRAVDGCIGIEDRARHDANPDQAEDWPSDATIQGVDAHGVYHDFRSARLSGPEMETIQEEAVGC